MNTTINDNKNLRLFFRFLKNNDVYRQYLNNIQYSATINHKYVSNKKFTTEFFDLAKCNPKILINHPFIWRSTQEGYYFWHNIHYQWNEMILKLKYECKF